MILASRPTHLEEVFPRLAGLLWDYLRLRTRHPPVPAHVLLYWQVDRMWQRLEPQHGELTSREAREALGGGVACQRARDRLGTPLERLWLFTEERGLAGLRPHLQPDRMLALVQALCQRMCQLHPVLERFVPWELRTSLPPDARVVRAMPHGTAWRTDQLCICQLLYSWHDARRVMGRSPIRMGCWGGGCCRRYVVWRCASWVLVVGACGAPAGRVCVVVY